MKTHTLSIERDMKRGRQKGFSLPELVVVLLVGAIILVLALPQIISSRRLFRFSGLQRQVATSLREARQEAMSQRKPVTFRYDNSAKRLVIYGGDFGALGDAKNRVVSMTGSGVEPDDVKYGRPTGVPTAALSDTTNLSNLSSNAVEITFQPDGSVVDASNNPQNQALFFYHEKYRLDTSFAVSVLGAGGRIKVWRYSQGVNSYVE
jgi:prepilin-type N-terminal cleavage/methylation domain-containing protein